MKMSDDAEDYESINLASMTVETQHLSSLATVPESSDDGLDPHEFLTQNQIDGVSNDTVSSPKNNSDTSVNEVANQSASLSISPLYESTLKDSVASTAFPGEELPFLDTEATWETRQQRESLLQFLSNRHESLKSDLRRDMKVHQEFIAQGSDCKQIRDIIGDRFVQMSENCLALNEIYEKENVSLRGFLNHLESWDLRRVRVLNRVKSIKSDKRGFGHKLAGLLEKSNDIDREINELESRLSVLRENKTVLEAEIDEASSILESKSAKYVNIFRELEKYGENAISGFLVSSGLPQNDLQVLLKKIPVETFFTYKSQPRNEKTVLSPARSSRLSNSVPDKSDAFKSDVTQDKANQIIPEEMGAQAFEVKDDELPSYTETSAYEKGFQKGNEQLLKVKETLASYVNSLLRGSAGERAEASRITKAIDDESNTITSKIDLEPIISLLSHRIRALEDLSIESSKRSADLHQDGELWRSITRILNDKERKLFDVLSHSNGMSPEVKDLLLSSLNALNKASKDLVSTGTGNEGVSHRYLKVLLHREAKAIASALDAIDKDSNFSSKLSSIESSFADGLSDAELAPKSISSFKLTHYGYRPNTISVVDTTTENVDGKGLRGGDGYQEKGAKDYKHE